ncbi:MAG TPA: 50S ribosomal protein L10 [Candidatus Latescibacteria bacterium]|jgi:large subunit ribosomal protein L10|nr:50S ribosomal protein L10 [Candidatus Handelsmanbacteria bacterium]HIL07272.1 50S ribosomal protein L10 [Candidatus Latescibacterota bacterium]
MATVEKEGKIAELKVILAEAKGLYLADFTGIDVEAVNELRNKLRDAEVHYQVIKNRLAIRAAEEAGIAGLKEHFTGPTAIAYSNEDPVAPAKILQGFADDGGKMLIKSGYMDGKILAADEVQVIAKLPSREELLGKVVGSVQSPLYGFSAVLNGLLRGLVGVLSAVEKQKGKGGESA